jgi:hypothetical protein
MGTCREEPLEVARFRELRDLVSALPYVNHRDGHAAEPRDQALEPVFARRDRMRGKDSDESSLPFLNALVERVAEGEVFRPQPHDPGAMRRRDVACAIDRARVHEQYFEIAVSLTSECFKDLWKPPLLVEGADDDARFGGMGACHGIVASST